MVRQSTEIVLFSPSGSSLIPADSRNSFLSSISDSYQRGEDFEAFVEQRERDGRISFRWHGESKDGVFKQGGYDRRK